MSTTAVTTSRASRERIDECLTLQAVAAGEGVTILQLCCVDHSGPLYDTPHLHIQCIFSDSTRSPWVLLPTTYIADLQAAINALPGSVRLHMHEPAPSKTKPADSSVVGRLPHIILCETATARLAQGDAACPICLVDYKLEDDIICLPCNGLHKAHSACMKSWLATADTCPTCRFPMPADDDPKLPDLIKRAKDELCQLQRVSESPRCIPVTKTGTAKGAMSFSSDLGNSRRKRERAARLRSSRTNSNPDITSSTSTSTSTTSVNTSTSNTTSTSGTGTSDSTSNSNSNSTSGVSNTDSGTPPSSNEPPRDSASFATPSRPHNNTSIQDSNGMRSGDTVAAAPSRRRGWSLTGALSRRMSRKTSSTS